MAKKSELPSPTTAQSLGSLLKSARDIMRKDKGLNGDLDRLPLLTWIMFLKFLDDLELQGEEEAQLAGKKFRPAVEAPYRWRDWASNPQGVTGDELIAFINNDECIRPDGNKGAGLFRYLRTLTSSNGDDRRDVIATVFKGVDNRMKSGYLLRDVVNKIGGIHFTSNTELHTLGTMYESMLREMRDAAGDSGEFYTPRAVVRFMVEVSDPRLGESVLDPASGTGGFLVESYNHLAKQVKTVADRKVLQQRSLIGCEPKPLPYLLCQMNLLLHGSTAIAGADVDGCAASGEFPTFALDEKCITPRWVHWQTKTKGFWTKCDVLSRGSSGKNRIKPELFLTIPVPLPPLAEQRRVVARIEELAAQIREAQALRHQAVDEAAVLIPSGMAAILKKLSEKHSTKTLDELCDVVRGGSPRPAGSPLFYGGDIPFMKVGDLTKDDGMYLLEASASVNELGREQSRFIEADTLMLTNSGATLGVPKITKIAGCFNDGSQAFLNLSSDVEKEFLYYLFKSKTLWFREQMGRGQGQPNLNADMTKQMDIPIPPLPEQRRIVAELDALQAKVGALKRLQSETATELDALLPAILDRAFKGEL